MKKILSLVASLTIISAICAAVLAYINIITADPIKQTAALDEKAAVQQVMPQGVTDVNEVNKGVFVGKNSNGEIIGYAAKGQDDGGYGGKIVLMVGFTTSFEIVSYKSLQASETPGLGTKLSSAEFSSQFAGKNALSPLKVKKDGGEIEAITSATITSRAVCGAINDAAKKVKQAK
ncbi:MAG: RnfABCDGE type electron transport complex subunit G [Kiritimatiellae bacterium]|nr:RnfABCDGE type electron transport complex subunit G [Kiritimatiellia bacterium]